MLKRTIKYLDYDGVEREEDFYFNLSRSELMKMELKEVGGLAKRLERIIKAKETHEIAEHFERVILDAYGEKSADGKHFRKSPEISQSFKETPAYDELFVEITTNDEAAVAFIQGVTQTAKDKPIIMK